MTPGIHRIDNAAYHAGPGVSKTGLWTIATKTPAHYRFGEQRTTTFFDIGTAAHIALLEPEQFERGVYRGPDDRRGAKWTDAKEAARMMDGMLLLTSGDYDKCLRIRDAGERSETLRTVRKGALIEHAGYAIDPETGVLCRCKPDAYNPDLGLILDLKTTTAGGPQEFQRSAFTYGYHVQEAFYTDVWDRAIDAMPDEGWVANIVGPAISGFIFVVIEKTAPFLVSCYELTPNAVEEGRAVYRKALETYATCRRMEDSGVPAHIAWPGYPDRPEPLDLPRWGYRETIPQEEV